MYSVIFFQFFKRERGGVEPDRKAMYFVCAGMAQEQADLLVSRWGCLQYRYYFQLCSPFILTLISLQDIVMSNLTSMGI